MTTTNTIRLMGLIAIAWLLILGETYVFIFVIRPLGPQLHVGDVPSAVTKITLTAGLGVLWVVVMLAMDAVYSRQRRTPTPAS